MRPVTRAAIGGLFAMWLAPLAGTPLAGTAAAPGAEPVACRDDRPAPAEPAAAAPERPAPG